MRKPFAQAGKGQSGNQLSPPTLLTHLRGPSVLSYGHFGSSWARPTSGLRQPPTVPTAQTASKIAAKSRGFRFSQQRCYIRTVT